MKHFLSPMPLAALAAILFVAVQFPIIRAEAAATTPEFRVIGYLPDYRFKQFDAKHAAPLTDLILFAAEPNAEGELDMSKIAQAPWEKLWTYRQEFNTRLILCVGGWGKSDYFSKAVASIESRKLFATSILSEMEKYKLDGLDLDWEYPESKAEWERYIKLLQELKGEFSKKNYTLSLTISPWKELPIEAWKTVDRVQLMCYDYGQRHSTVKHAESDVQSFVKKGIPPEKIVLGIPFYGRNIDDRKAMPYSRVVDQFQPAPEVDEVNNIFFNGPQTVAKKTRLALDAGIGGVMIWEIGQDMMNEHSLINTISRTVSRAKLESRPKATRRN
ncbi:glycoside hydrolase family 18 protein [Planctomicrobium sp. SH668]|uniref:glycoside hydrolase family 18 protein n=1 Tax=Planctomicrobium sp. SH668 TaxID=3448126 RepID=UPI003F5B4975